MPSKRKATATDADLILKLYDLRREVVMRQARNWFAVEFWPQSCADLVNVLSNFGSQENAYFRQVIGYWDMACSLVLRGALDEDLFFDNSNEMYFLLSKFYRFLGQFRKEMKAPDALVQIETVATRTPKAQQRLAQMEARTRDFVATRSAKAAGQ